MTEEGEKLLEHAKQAPQDPNEVWNEVKDMSQELSESEDVAASVPEQAAQVLGERQTHGEAYENHAHIARLWTAYLSNDSNVTVSARNVADMMQMVKMSRAKTGQVIEDHYVDICGYAGIAYSCAERDGEVEE